MGVPYIGFGNDQLDDQPACREGDMVECPHCNQQHPVEFGRDMETGQKTNLLGFYKCGGKTYLAAVGGRFVTGVEPCCKGEVPDKDDPLA